MFSSIDVEKNIHHAYLLEGEKKVIFQELLDFLDKKLNFFVKANPDFWLGEFDTLGIDDSRAFKEFQSRKSFSGGKKILVIKTNFITHEAQNSLLKVFEEPTKNTHLFLIMPSIETILPTLCSRLLLIKHSEVQPPNGSLGGSTSKLEVGGFLKASLSERLEMIKVFLPKSKEDKVSKAEVISFLNDLEKFLYESDRIVNSEVENVFSEIRQCRSYLNDRSPSVKMILEHLSQII